MLALVDVYSGTVCLALTLPLLQRWGGGRGAEDSVSVSGASRTASVQWG